MSLYPIISAGLGGLGLFLLGIWLMSDGLKMAAGNTLNQLLHHWTNTRLRSLGVGIVLTTLIQSSSAVTVAIVGFTNAGLLSLRRAIWVVFGSSIGTTSIGWLIILIGFNFKISSFALPMVGIGMVLKLIKSDSRLGALGQALVGFGIFFMGIEVLKDTFSVLGEQMFLTSNGVIGITDILLYIGFGFLITTLVQSSGVIIAITLTALSGGVITLLSAAAIVIGSNLGSTTAAIFSSFGAKPVAKRLVASYVIFKFFTALVMLFLVSPLLSLLSFIQHLFHLGDASTTTLALFHTSFNILGVLLIWPLADKIIIWLSRRFKTKDEDIASPLYLDKNALTLSSLALHGLYKELERVGHYSILMAKKTINFDGSNNNTKEKDTVVEKLTTAIGDYTSELNKQNLSQDIANALPNILRISQYFNTIAELTFQLNVDKKWAETAIDISIQQQIDIFYKHSIILLNYADIAHKSTKTDELQKELNMLEAEYQSLKSLLLRRGAEGKLSIAKMDKTLNSISQIRRIFQQAVKAFIHFETLHIELASHDNDKIDENITTV